MLSNIKSKIDFSKIKKYILGHKLISAIAATIIIYVIYFTYTKITTPASATQYVFGKVQRGDLVVTVAGSGQVATLSQVTIKPQTTGQAQTLGQIISVKVQNGDFVQAGQVIAILDGKSALQSLNQAEASVASAQASYDKLVNGPTASDLQSINNSLTNDQVSLTNLKQNIAIQLKSAYSEASNEVYIDTDPYFIDPTNVDRSFSVPGITFSSPQLINNITNGRDRIDSMLTSWNTEINNLSNTATSSDIIAALNDSIENLNTLRSYFDDMTTLFSVYSNSQTTSGQSAINSGKSTASSARGNMDSSISNLTSELQSYNNAILKLQEDQQSLAFQTAPADPDDVIVSKAQLDNAKANLATAQQTYDSRIITAPFAGQIGGLNAQIGQQVSSSDSLGTIITAQKVVNVTLNEVDAAKVSAGDPVTLTFDALPNVTLNGQVSYLDPLGTVSSGVVNYDVQVGIDDQNNQIKTGMTATAEIVTTTATNTLMIPTSAITTSGGKEYVLVETNSSSTLGAGMSSSTFSAAARAGFASSTYGYGSTTASTTRKFRNASSTGQYGNTATGSTPVANASVTQVQITIGISNNTETQVLSGLTAGESIVVRTITGASTTKTAAASATTRTTGTGGATRAVTGGGFGGGAVGAFTGGGAMGR